MFQAIEVRNTFFYVIIMLNYRMLFLAHLFLECIPAVNGIVIELQLHNLNVKVMCIYT